MNSFASGLRWDVAKSDPIADIRSVINQPPPPPMRIYFCGAPWSLSTIDRWTEVEDGRRSIEAAIAIDPEFQALWDAYAAARRRAGVDPLPVLRVVVDLAEKGLPAGIAHVGRLDGYVVGVLPQGAAPLPPSLVTRWRVREPYTRAERRRAARHAHPRRVGATQVGRFRPKVEVHIAALDPIDEAVARRACALAVRSVATR